MRLHLNTSRPTDLKIIPGDRAGSLLIRNHSIRPIIRNQPCLVLYHELQFGSANADLDNRAWISLLYSWTTWGLGWVLRLPPCCFAAMIFFMRGGDVHGLCFNHEDNAVVAEISVWT
jgi:hypothetical protein